MKGVLLFVGLLLFFISNANSITMDASTVEVMSGGSQTGVINIPNGDSNQLQVTNPPPSGGTIVMMVNFVQIQNETEALSYFFTVSFFSDGYSGKIFSTFSLDNGTIVTVPWPKIIPSGNPFRANITVPVPLDTIVTKKSLPLMITSKEEGFMFSRATLDITFPIATSNTTTDPNITPVSPIIEAVARVPVAYVAGGASAGAFLLLLIVIIVAIAITRRRAKQHVVIKSDGQSEIGLQAALPLLSVENIEKIDKKISRGKINQGSVNVLLISTKDAQSPSVSSIASLSHPNVMKMLGIFTEKKSNFLVFEFSGKNRLIDNTSAISSTLSARLAETLKGLIYIVDRGYFPAKFSAENIFLNNSNIATIGDVQLISKDQSHPFTLEKWMKSSRIFPLLPPELALKDHQQFQENSVTFWFGISVLQILDVMTMSKYVSCLFSKNSSTKFIEDYRLFAKEITLKDEPKSIPSTFWTEILKSISENPQQRPSLSNCLSSLQVDSKTQGNSGKGNSKYISEEAFYEEGMKPYVELSGNTPTVSSTHYTALSEPEPEPVIYSNQI